jgi:hypothetical protein
VEFVGNLAAGATPPVATSGSKAAGANLTS